MNDNYGIISSLNRIVNILSLLVKFCDTQLTYVMFIIKKNLNKFAVKEIETFSFRALPFHVETEHFQVYQLQIHVQLDGRNVQRRQ